MCLDKPAKWIKELITSDTKSFYNIKNGFTYYYDISESNSFPISTINQGPIINDSIILVTAFKENREKGLDINDAIEKAACSRLRPVILTSLTTTLGLVPMLLESSPMGAAMAPLAVVICFGMLYGTFLILLVIPALLWSIEARREKRAHKKAIKQNSGAALGTPVLTGNGL